jgi:hypothetical protein
MPTTTGIVSAARRIPWSKVLVAGQYVLRKGSAARGALSDAERKQLLDLIRKSKGLPQNLAEHERTRVRELAAKALDAARKA